MALGLNGREGEMCDDYGTWKEEIYWRHFKCLHFCQILPSDDEFHKHLLIPKKFADNARASLPQKVTLRGPGGASWHAVVAMIGSDLFLSDGWEDFAKAYSLQPNNILIFKYDGVSIFDVLIFDGENLCEKESAYFVKKCGLVDPSVEGKRKRISSDDDVEENGDDAGVERGSKQAREEVGMKAMDESKKVLRNTKSRSRSYAKREKFVHRKSASSKASPAKKVPTAPKNLAKSFAEPGKSPIKNATSILGPGPKITTEGPHRKNTLRSNRTTSTESPAEYSTPSNGNGTPESPLQGAQQMNGSFPTKTSPLSAKKVSEKTKVTRGVASRRGRPRKEAVSSRGRKKASLSEVEINSAKKVASADKLASETETAEGVEDIDPGSPESINNLYVSEAGKMAVERARKEMTDASFFAIMRPTSVSRRFLLTVPGAFQRVHLAPKTQDVFLRIGDKTWLTRLNYSAGKTTGQICGGWKQFVLENHLEQFDVCLFKLVRQSEDSVMLDVGIFRAGPAEPAPPSPPPPPPPMEAEVDPPIHVVDG